jgi:hypothetical protein
MPSRCGLNAFECSSQHSFREPQMRGLTLANWKSNEAVTRITTPPNQHEALTRFNITASHHLGR